MKCKMAELPVWCGLTKIHRQSCESEDYGGTVFPDVGGKDTPFSKVSADVYVPKKVSKKMCMSQKVSEMSEVVRT